jgi:hypothetical protein
VPVCWQRTVLAVPSYVLLTASIPWDDWPCKTAYQWGALVKAPIVHRTCALFFGLAAEGLYARGHDPITLIPI